MITELSKEQREAMEEYRRKGISLGIDTTPTSDERIREIVRGLYKYILKEKMPSRLIICDSPKSGWDFIQKEEGEKMDYVHPYLDGHLFSYFFSYYDFMRNILKVIYACNFEYEILRGILEFGNFWPLEGYCVVTRKPVIAKMDADDKYHREDGPAVEYADGYGVYMLHGVVVPKWLVETPWEKLDAHKYTTIRNAEVRREFVRKLGVERLIQKLGAEVVDKKGDYELVLVDLGGETGKCPFLKMLNPSIGTWHVEAVSPECRTVEDALRFRNGSSLQPEQLT